MHPGGSGHRTLSCAWGGSGVGLGGDDIQCPVVMKRQYSHWVGLASVLAFALVDWPPIALSYFSNLHALLANLMTHTVPFQEVASLFKLSRVTHWLQVTWTPEYLSPFFASCISSCLLDNSTCMSHRQTHLFPLNLPFFRILSLVNSTCDLFSRNPERKTS